MKTGDRLKAIFIFISFNIIAITVLFWQWEILRYIKKALVQEPIALKVGMLSEPHTLDPHKVSRLISARILSNVFSRLVRVDAKGEIIPDAAKSWTISSDGKSITFIIRQYKWSNGNDVTAYDFERGFRRLIYNKSLMSNGVQYGTFIQKKNNGGNLLNNVDSIGLIAVSENELKVLIKDSPQECLNALTSIFFAPIADSTITRGKGQEYNINVSNGPFYVDKWHRSGKIVLKKNKFFYNSSEVAVDRIEYIPFNGYTALERAFDKGEIDLALDIHESGSSKKEILGKYQDLLMLHVSTHSNLLYIGQELLYTYPFLDDVFNLILDRQEVIDKVRGGFGMPLFRVLPPTMDISSFMPEVVYNKIPISTLHTHKKLEIAHHIMHKNGFSNLKRMKIKIMSVKAAINDKVVMVLRELLDNVYIDLNVEYYDSETYFVKTRAGDFDITSLMFNTFAKYNRVFIERFMSGAPARYIKSHNYKGSNIDYMNAFDVKAMAIAYGILLNDGGVVPVYCPEVAVLVSKRIKGFYLDPTYTQSALPYIKL